MSDIKKLHGLMFNIESGGGNEMIYILMENKLMIIIIIENEIHWYTYQFPCTDEEIRNWNTVNLFTHDYGDHSIIFFLNLPDNSFTWTRGQKLS